MSSSSYEEDSNANSSVGKRGAEQRETQSDPVGSQHHNHRAADASNDVDPQLAAGNVLPRMHLILNEPERRDSDTEYHDVADGSRSSGPDHETEFADSDSESFDDDEEIEECWSAEAASGQQQDLELGLWVAPADRHRFLSTSLVLSDEGKLGLHLQHRASSNKSSRKRRRRRRSKTRESQDFQDRMKRHHLLVDNSITLHGFAQEVNPHAADLQRLVPLGSVLQMFNGVLVQDAEHFYELVQEARWKHVDRVNHVRSEQPSQGNRVRTVVTLLFALPLEARSRLAWPSRCSLSAAAAAAPCP